MVELGYQSNMSNLFPPWLFPTFNLIGFMPLKITNSGLKFVPWSAVISLAVTTTLAVLLCYKMYTDPPFRTADTMKNIVNLIKELNVVLGAIFIAMHNIVVSNTGRFDSILSHISEVETAFINKGFSSKSGRNISDRLTYIFFGVLLFFLIPLSVTVNPGTEKTAKISFYICHIYIIVMEILFIRLAELLSCSGIKLNKLIQRRNILEYKVKKVVLSSDTPKITIEEIRKVHYKLCKAIEEINSFFGIQLVCVFTYIFGLAVFNAYCIVDGFIKPESRIFDKLFILKQMCWSLYAAAQLVAITWISSYTSYHVKRTGFHVSCLLSLELLPESRNKVKLALMQISSNTCEFNVLDLYKVNTTIITSFAGMAVTYFIVILQFESSNKH